MSFFQKGMKRAYACCLFTAAAGRGATGQWHSVAEYYTERGYTCASVSYRLAPTHRFPSQIEDVRLAIAYLKENAAKYCFHEERIVAFGSSAGGHLAIMLALLHPNDDLGVTSELRVLDTRPSAVVAYCPVTDLCIDRQFVLDFMGGNARRAGEAIPIGLSDRKGSSRVDTFSHCTRR